MKKLRLKIPLLLMALFVSSTIANAGACGCSFSEGGVEYAFDYFTTVDDCCTPTGGYAIVDSRNSETGEENSEYITVKEAVGACCGS